MNPTADVGRIFYLQQGVVGSAGCTLAAMQSLLQMVAAIEVGTLTDFDTWAPEDVAREGGSVHEVRIWIASFADATRLLFEPLVRQRFTTIERILR
ncbi:hypothetical protein [Nocardia fluminea]|uniref:hypothetical protein n=1 Tax=Nocardia fluminea TaxID=134984 RepID=UPI0033E8FAAD